MQCFNPITALLVVVFFHTEAAHLFHDDPGARQTAVFDEEAVDVLELGVFAVEDPHLVGARACALVLAAERGRVPAVGRDMSDAHAAPKRRLAHRRPLLL